MATTIVQTDPTVVVQADSTTLVVAPPATETPLIESGAGDVGVSIKYAREDHVHPAGGGGGGGGGGGASVLVSATPPVAPSDNSLWFETDSGLLFIRYFDGAGAAQWVQVLGGGSPALETGAFAVDRNGVNQSGGTPGQYLKILFTTKQADASNWFDTTLSRYTPQRAGSYALHLNAATNVGTGGETTQVALFKNGTRIKAGPYFATSGASAYACALSAVVPMNGTTDYVECHTWMPATITSVQGNPQTTNFQGYWVGD